MYVGMYLNEDPGLVISVGAEPRGLLGRDGSAALDERCHDTTTRLDAQTEGRVEYG